jgi:hypothetical protein
MTDGGARAAWMAGSSPAMTAGVGESTGIAISANKVFVILAMDVRISAERNLWSRQSVGDRKGMKELRSSQETFSDNL